MFVFKSATTNTISPTPTRAFFHRHPPEPEPWSPTKIRTRLTLFIYKKHFIRQIDKSVFETSRTTLADLSMCFEYFYHEAPLVQT